MSYQTGRSLTPWYVLAFICGLILLQLGALRLQFVRGFRIFAHEPVRVPFSWDMFSNRVERCSLNWEPALQTPRGPFSSLRQLGTTLEWDYVLDVAAGYQQIAKWVCAVGGKATHVKLHCLFPNGTQTHDELNCG